MHHTDRRAAVAEFGKCLRASNWRLWGWKEDKSDSMTDYYDPETWSGIATKDGAVCVVDRSSKWGMSDSGRKITRQEERDHGPCPHCEGEGTEPGLREWTLERAKASPEEFHRAEVEVRAKTGDRSLNLFPTVVSPIPFQKHGVMNCHRCGGSGRVKSYETVETGETWPTFQPNPPRMMWHVERDGKILVSGVGLSKFLRLDINKFYRKEDHEEHYRWVDALAGVTPILNKINGAAIGYRVQGDTIKGAIVTEAEWSINEALGGVEVRFPSNPGPEVCAGLKAAGFRFSRRQKLWWAKQTEARIGYAKKLTGKEVAA